MKSAKRREILIGIWVIAALAILIFGINFLKGVNIFKASNYYYAVYDNVEGLSVSGHVTLNGYQIGQVREINYDFAHPGNVIVEISVDKALKLPRDTKAVITTDILGTGSIVLQPGNPANGYAAVGDTLSTGVNKGLMGSIGENLMPAVGAIVPKVDTLLSNLTRITGDPALLASVQRLDAITSDLNTSIRSLNSLMTQLQPVARNFKSITDNVDSITSDLTHTSAAIKRVPLDSIVSDLSSTLANLQEVTRQLNNPDGTIGRLSADPALYDNLNASVVALDSLLVDIKKNPKRYISIKLL